MEALEKIYLKTNNIQSTRENPSGDEDILPSQWFCLPWKVYHMVAMTSNVHLFWLLPFFSDSKLVKKSFKNLLPFAVCLLHGFLTSRFKESYGPLHKGKKWFANIHAIFHAILGDDCGDHPDTPRPKGENVLSQNNIWTSWQFYFSR